MLDPRAFIKKFTPVIFVRKRPKSCVAPRVSAGRLKAKNYYSAMPAEIINGAQVSIISATKDV